MILLRIVFCLASDSTQCHIIQAPARVRCGDEGTKQLQCLVQGCCWDDKARGSDIACYINRKYSKQIR